MILLSKWYRGKFYMLRYYLAMLLSALYYSCPSTALSQVLIIIPGQSATCPPPTQQQWAVAITKAKQALPKFWDYYRVAWLKDGRFEVLLLFQKSRGANAVLWASVKSVAGTTVEGILLESDQMDKRLSKGAVVVFNKTDPLDWKLKSNGGNAWYGWYSLRESLPQCDKKNRDTMVNVFLTRVPDW
jgi:hypothetical protein